MIMNGDMERKQLWHYYPDIHQEGLGKIMETVCTFSSPAKIEF
jgi:hypothetical protein